MFIKILIALAVILLIFVIVVATRPSDFKIVRSATISAPPATVFGEVNELRKWEAWSPWAKMDPQMKQTYEGPPAGNGAISRWVGNSQVGEGNMTIVESHPNDLIKIRLEFVKPFPGVNDVEFTFKPEGSNQTAVTWTMTGKYAFVPKAVGLFMNMDKMIGDQFEQGLAQLKPVCEAKPAN